MKLEEDLIKSLLQGIRDAGDGITWQCEHITSESSEEEKKRAYHLKLLVNMGLLEGHVAKYDYLGGGGQMKIIYVDLTHNGHTVLETMENDTLLNKVKTGLLEIGMQAIGDMAVSTIKVAPVLLIKKILSGFGGLE